MTNGVFHIHLPKIIAGPAIVNGAYSGSVFNVTALVILLLLTWVLVRGVKESARTYNTMVVIKLAAILIFVIGASSAIKTDNWHPFMPNGFSGVLTGAAIVFFTYIGFDSVSTAAEECGKPQRDMPLEGHAVNLSETGIVVEIDSMIPIGQAVTLEFQVSGLGRLREEMWPTYAVAGEVVPQLGR